jgi:hypothetical protein
MYRLRHKANQTSNSAFMKPIFWCCILGMACLSAIPAAVTAQVLRAPIQYFRPYDQRGVNVFETPKIDTVAYEGFALRLGASLTQGYQNIRHENTTGQIGTPNAGPGGVLIRPTQLLEIGGGFPLATANLNIDAQLAEGIRLHLVSYMSSHHHNEFWVKGGYLQVDRVTFIPVLDKLFEKYLSLKVGHFEVNYGDQHFRRSDGGQTLWNPFMEGNIMDAFTTEIGAELYFQSGGIIAMIAATDGEIQGQIARPNDRSPSLYGKLGYDKQLTDALRLRITGSVMNTASSINNTLFGGDRTGANYQWVMEPTNATLSGNAFSGRFNPRLSDKLTTVVINPFVKFNGLEIFGTYELAEGRGANDANQGDRKATQYALDIVYRFGATENIFVGARYNTVKARLASTATVTQTGDVTINRNAIAAGWFITPTVVLKGEYVWQEYRDYLPGDILDGGEFKGVVLQGAICF